MCRKFFDDWGDIRILGPKKKEEKKRSPEKKSQQNRRLESGGDREKLKVSRVTTTERGKVESKDWGVAGKRRVVNGGCVRGGFQKHGKEEMRDGGSAKWPIPGKMKESDSLHGGGKKREEKGCLSKHPGNKVGPGGEYNCPRRGGTPSKTENVPRGAGGGSSLIKFVKKGSKFNRSKRRGGRREKRTLLQGAREKKNPVSWKRSGLGKV